MGVEALAVKVAALPANLAGEAVCGGSTKAEVETLNLIGILPGRDCACADEIRPAVRSPTADFRGFGVGLCKSGFLDFGDAKSS